MTGGVYEEDAYCGIFVCNGAVCGIIGVGVTGLVEWFSCGSEVPECDPRHKVFTIMARIIPG